MQYEEQTYPTHFMSSKEITWMPIGWMPIRRTRSARVLPNLGLMRVEHNRFEHHVKMNFSNIHSELETLKFDITETEVELLRLKLDLTLIQLRSVLRQEADDNIAMGLSNDMPELEDTA